MRQGERTAFLRLGDPVPHHHLEEGARIVADDPLLRRQADRPWFRAYAAERTGSPLGPSRPRTPSLPFGDVICGGAAGSVPADAFERHCVVSGATGTGKSRLMELLVARQIEGGCSAVVFDPKGEGALIDRLLDRARALGVPASSVTLFDFRRPEGIPGWNLLQTGVPLYQAVGDVVSTFGASASSWGPRLQDVLTNALLLVGSLPGLSFYELVELLRRDDYREALLHVPADPPDPAAYEEARSYFLHEFGAWSPSERVAAAGPVLNKLKETLRSPCLRPLLCARSQTFSLPDLWKRPGLLLVKADPSTIGDEGVRLLMGFLAHGLLRAAQRAPGPVPVALCLDELPLIERFIGSALVEILTTARSLRLRLLVACQHLSGISAPLREALYGNAAVQAFFRMGESDARWAGAMLASGAEPRLSRVFADVASRDRRTGRPELAEWRHPLYGPDDRPLRVGKAAWDRYARRERSRPEPPLAHLMGSAPFRLPRLYVHDPVTGEPTAAERYVEKLPPECYWVDGPRLELVVVFPKPKFTGAERQSEAESGRKWSRRLQELEVRHAVVRVDGKLAGEIRVQDVSRPPLSEAERERYVRDCLKNGQSRKEIERTRQWRREEVERTTSGVPDAGGREAAERHAREAERKGRKGGKDRRPPEKERPSQSSVTAAPGLPSGLVEADE